MVHADSSTLQYLHSMLHALRSRRCRCQCPSRAEPRTLSACTAACGKTRQPGQHHCQCMWNENGVFSQPPLSSIPAFGPSLAGPHCHAICVLPAPSCNRYSNVRQVSVRIPLSRYPLPLHPPQLDRNLDKNWAGGPEPFPGEAGDPIDMGIGRTGERSPRLPLTLFSGIWPLPCPCGCSTTPTLSEALAIHRGCARSVTQPWQHAQSLIIS